MKDLTLIKRIENLENLDTLKMLELLSEGNLDLTLTGEYSYLDISVSESVYINGVSRVVGESDKKYIKAQVERILEECKVN